jgi:PIN domain nuclease of toxin-antitoxin system
MARVIRLDTHAVVWLYAGEIERFTPEGQALLESEQLTVSPIVQLELTFLHEIGRLRMGGADVLGDLESRVRLYVVNQPFIAVVQAAASISWTRDPFDRLIVGDALAANCQLLTKDDTIREHLSLALW